MSRKPPVVTPELKAALKALNLGKLIDVVPDRLLLAQQQRMEPQELLLLVLHDEISRRQSTATTRRAKNAGLDPDMVFERWDTSAKVSFDARVLTELRSLRFITEHKNALILGPVGVGKSFLSNALGPRACRHRYHEHGKRLSMWIHFGGGAHKCISMHLARMLFLLSFRAPLGKHQVEYAMDDYYPAKLQHFPFARPIGSLPVRLEAREALG